MPTAYKINYLARFFDAKVAGVAPLELFVLRNELFALSCRVAHAKGGCRIGAGVDWCSLDPGFVGDDDPVFVLRDDAGEVAIFLALRVVVRFDDGAHSAELIFEPVDAFGSDDAVEAGDFVAYPDEGIVRARGLRCLRHCPSLVEGGGVVVVAYRDCSGVLSVGAEKKQ